MANQHWQKVDEIFNAALRRTPNERPLFLNQICKDDQILRGEVDSLLSSFDSSEDFLKTPVIDAVADSLTADQLTNGQQFGQFEIIERIGKGGMGEVYLARDLKLKRQVALKLLPARFIPDEERLKRFEQEAFAVSSLNHPNILTLYDIGKYADVHFIVMEYVDGVSLDECRAGDDELGLTNILDIAIQISSALSAAHEAGIIHRDIKPENIMIRTDGYIKILDFGVAKLTEKHGQFGDGNGTVDRPDELTQAGTVIGTASYMSPEQARGKETDERTDIWSLGVVLYEILAGEKPFKGETAADIVVEIIHNEALPISEYVANLPPELEELIRKALCKELDGRYQTAKDLLEDLEKIKHNIEFQDELERSVPPDKETGAKNAELPETKTREFQTARPAISAEYLFAQVKTHKLGAFLILPALLIAMMTVGYYYRSLSSAAPILTDKDVILLIDFENKTGEEIFDGTLKQGLMMQLQQSPFLSLFPNERVRYTLKLMKRSPDEPVTREVGREICERQGLKVLIAGSIVKLDRNYSLTLEAVNSRTGETVAVTQVEAKGKDEVLSSLSEAATEMREKLGESLALIEKFDKPLPQVTTSSLEALKVATMGLKLKERGKPLEAIELFKRAVEIDPEFAIAYRALWRVYLRTGQIELGKEAIIKGYELREETSEKEKLVIDISYAAMLNDSPKVFEGWKIMTQLYPREWGGHNNLGFHYRRHGQPDKAVIEFEEALRLNPDAYLPYGNLSGVYKALNRFEESKEIIERAFQHNFDHIMGLHYKLYQIAFVQNDTKAMRKALDWFRGRHDQYLALSLQAESAAYRGQWRRSRDQSGQAIDLAMQEGHTGAHLLGSEAMRAAELKQCRQAKISAKKALTRQTDQWAIVRSTYALAKCGRISRAHASVKELAKEFPEDVRIKGIWVPVLKAEIEMQKRKPKEAIKILETVRKYEHSPFTEFRTQYTRGQAFLKLKENEKAKIEFQKILDHRGEAPLSVLYPLAQLGKARATKDKREYEKFFEIWKDADKDLPALVKAKKEYKELG